MNKMNRLQALLSLLIAIPALSMTAHAKSNDDDDAQRKSSWRSGPLIRQIRQATWVYRDVDMALGAGYIPTACASGNMGGAMGVHYVNPALLFNADGTPNGEFDIDTPEVLIYEPQANGSMKLVGVEFIVFAAPWDAANPGAGAPVARGQLFNYAGAPNRYALPAYYELHVWAYRKNPNGSFADWNPNVSCTAYDPS